MQQSQKKKIESQQREIEILEKQNEEQRLKIVKILERPKTAPIAALECTICAEEYVEPHLPTRFVITFVRANLDTTSDDYGMFYWNTRLTNLLSLKCGHVFGRECIEGWLTKKKVCPTCSAHATVQDFRTLYLV